MLTAAAEVQRLFGGTIEPPSPKNGILFRKVYQRKEPPGMNEPARYGFTEFWLILIGVLTCTFSTIARAPAAADLLPQPLFSRQSGWFFRGAWPDPKGDQSHGAAAR